MQTVWQFCEKSLGISSLSLSIVNDCPQSEDISLLKAEIETGYRTFEKLTELRDECSLLAWKKEDVGGKAEKR